MKEGNKRSELINTKEREEEEKKKVKGRGGEGCYLRWMVRKVLSDKVT